MKRSNPNLCEHAFGHQFYHMAHVLSASHVNQGYWLNGKRLTRKAEPYEKHKLIHIARAFMIFIDGKYVNSCITDSRFLGQCVFNAVMSKVVGTAFGIRALNYLKQGKSVTPSDLKILDDFKSSILRQARRRLHLTKSIQCQAQCLLLACGASESSLTDKMREIVMTILSTIEAFSALKRNDKIIVSDGTTEPPKHHTKKRATWLCNNYEGVVHEFERSRTGCYMKVSPRIGSMLVNCYPINGNKTFSLPDAA